MTEREENNRKLAEWLGLSHPHTVSHDEQQAEQSDACDQCGVRRDHHDRGIPDFYTDETANAMLRRRIRQTIPYMVIHREGDLEVVRFVSKAGTIFIGYGETDLVAICAAALLIAKVRV